MDDKITIIIPVYNVEKYLEQCLESVKNQDYKNFEAIVVNDGSTDNSLNVIEKVTSNDSRFKVYTKSNGGLSSARNYGVDKSKGKYVIFLDSDDFLIESCLTKLHDAAKRTDSDLVVSDYSLYFEKGDYYKYMDFAIVDQEKDDFHISQCTSACFKLLSYDLVKKVKFIEGILYEDINFSAITNLYASKITNVNESLFIYRKRFDEDNKSIMQFNDNRIFDIYSSLETLDFVLSDNHGDILEYIYIKHLLLFGTERFLDHKDSFKNVFNAIKYLDDKFVNWRNTSYIYSEEPSLIKTFRILCSSKANIVFYFKTLKLRNKLYIIKIKFKK